MFVVYHIASTHMVGPLPKSGKPHTLYARTYKTAHMAKRACDKYNAGKRTHWSAGHGNEVSGPGDYGWCSADHYQKRVVRMVERTNMMSGKKFMEPSNTPGYMSPSSEAYWSM